MNQLPAFRFPLSTNDKSLFLNLLHMCSVVLGLVLHKLLWHANGPGLGEFDRGPNGRRVLEHQVDLLEVATHGLGVQEVHGEGDAGTNGGKYNIKLPSNGVNGHRGHHDNDKVPIPAD